MRRALLVIGLLAGSLAFTAPAAATDPGPWQTCSGRSYINIAENASGGGDRRVFCRPNTAPPVGHIVNLKPVPHAQAGFCNAPFNAADNWNDCVSSVQGVFSDHDGSLVTNEYCVKFYDNDNATGEELLYPIFDPNNTSFRNFSTGLGGDNDRLTSFRWGRLDSFLNTCKFT